MGYDLQWAKDGSATGYFGMNMATMSTMVTVMERAGLIDREAEPGWRWGLTPAQSEAILRFRSPRRGQVPVAKFVSNDGWLVAPVECRTLADGLEARGRAAIEALDLDDRETQEWRQLVRQFARYCRRCARAGGFRVW